MDVTSIKDRAAAAPGHDHDQRRRTIAKAAADIIAREGIDAATIRRIAAQLGYSTKIVTTYFETKQELLLWAYRSIFDRGMRQFDLSVLRDPADLAGSLFWLTAAHDKGLSCWRIYVAIWNRASYDPVFAAEQRRWNGNALRSIASAVADRNADCADRQSAAQLLSAIVQGISFQILLDPDCWTEDRVRSALTQQVERLLGPPSL